MFVAVYFGSLFSPALLDDADSTHAEAAREMFVSGDYVTLHVNGVRYLEKAPLPYWLVAFCYHIFGVNEFAARLPMALSVLLLGVLAVVWGRRAFGERAGIYAGLFVYTSAGVFLVYARSDSRRAAESADRGVAVFLSDCSGAWRAGMATGMRDMHAWLWEC